MKLINRIKGTDDILPPESSIWQSLSETVRKTMAIYNYKEIICPIFESTRLFARGIGDTTDIVSKEMYSFEDKGNRNLTLRPEGTASVVRAYIEHSLGAKSPLVKLFYLGPMFRQEKPQKGRKREFNQFGIEVFGSDSALVDVEGISLNIEILARLGIKDWKLLINSIGDAQSRAVYSKELKKYLKGRLEKFCGDCRVRYERNPLRVFDCKVPTCRRELNEAPLIIDYLDEECQMHFDKVKLGLDRLNLNYEINPRLVRGLDYYTKTVFELVSSSVGAQDSLSGGGRYDLLVESLGGKPTPAFGFAAGIERLIMAMQQDRQSAYSESALDYYIAPGNDKILKHGLVFAEKLRKRDFKVEIDFLGRSMKAQMRDANRLNAKHVIVLGENEFSRGVYAIKNMATGEQKELSLDILPPQTDITGN